MALAATDPANPYGAALPWPDRRERATGPGRKAGALVVLVDGALTLYVERGGRTLLTWTDDVDRARRPGPGRARAGRDRAPRRPRPADGGEGRRRSRCSAAGATPLREALDAAGFVATPQGLR